MRVLVVRTATMQDVFHTLPALTDAMTAIPNIQFDWVTDEVFAEIPSWHPAVDKIIPISEKRWQASILATLRSGEWKRFRRDLKSRTYDAIIDVQGLLKNAFISRMAKGERYGFDKQSAIEPLSARFCPQRVAIHKQQHTVERIRQLFASVLGYDAPTAIGDCALDQSRLTEDLVAKTPYVVFVPGTSAPEKQWPEPRWCQLAQRVEREGFNIVLPSGDDQERERARYIAKCTDAIQVAPRLNLSGIASVLSQATAVVAVDTGLAHLAAALDVPTVSLYGPTNPAYTGTYGQSQVHLTADRCATVQLPSGAGKTLASLTSNCVWQYLAGILYSRPAARVSTQEFELCQAQEA